MATPLYSTKSISHHLLEEIIDSLKNLDYGSLEIYVVDHQVTQITKRQIKKTNHLTQKESTD
ncbi:MAG TPA: DUF2292 domain-containing protein [Candidatus Bathyarchaeia archaeon]|nr:DUF2292 domain-containing protein [Candidatus Bathyarchaeia archaeon]